ncbi:MAG TPA: thiamine phosphate synthase [Spirochaetota bacterium]|nr:thiamine phosphate synthase [Spirochaetota bacterium]HPC42259.1 thiamine phosphate synthase [Spirochaetota bacterium]HPL17787.1 thiamine phosphate synthase [Spirochaetota bacterium]HQF09964.1 thiamine phosphate synthase [Spirochaetota bacterium]HQH98669.1 thiamine phosphate synthase [Spirochaetota bacterium]
MEQRIYAAIDANLNRALEGVRVCEDVMRFCLRRTDLSTRLKDVRHRIAGAAKRFPSGMLLHGRDVEGDGQKYVDLGGEGTRNSLADLFSANIHRAMEAVRSLEEFGKLAVPGWDDNPFQNMRFSLYDIERDGMPFLKRRQKIDSFRRSLYAILDSSYVKRDDFDDAVTKMIRGGASVIHLRMKASGKGEILTAARDIATLCREGKVLFIVNDHVDIAVLAGADGVHLGLNDLRANEARKLIPPDMIIGITAYTAEDPARIESDGADYVAVGPVFDTVYNSASGPVTIKGTGVEVIYRARAAVSMPIVAIGGITPEGAGRAFSAGADSIAVASYLYNDNKIEENCRALAEAIEVGTKADE